jgi:hypothetical protein
MQVMFQTPKGVIDSSASGGAAHADHPQSHLSEFVSIEALTLSISQEPRRDDGMLRLRSIKKKWKVATRASSRSSNGHNKIQNRYPTKLQLAFL